MTEKLKVPAIGEYVRGIGKLVKVETIQPPTPKPYEEYIFEEIEARTELRFGDEVLKKFETLCDFYGQSKSVEEAIRSAKNSAEIRHLTKDSELEVVAIKIVKQNRKIPNLEEINYCAKDYMNFKHSPDYRAFRDVPEPIEEVVWSSKKDLE